MKSEKAEKYLYDHECGYPYSGYVTMQDAERAAGLAEQEAEERMREKAHRIVKEMMETMSLRIAGWFTLSTNTTTPDQTDI